MTKSHWYLGYSNKTACGLLAYVSDCVDCKRPSNAVDRRFISPTDHPIYCARKPEHVNCRSCRRVMLLPRRGKHCSAGREDSAI